MYVNAKQLAERLGITVATVYRLFKSGELPSGYKLGKSRRWDLDEVGEYLKNKMRCKNGQS